MRMYDYLKAHKPGVLESHGLDSHPILSLFRGDPQPVLIVVHGVPVSAVLSEGGETPETTIEGLETMADLLPPERHVLNINFRLRVPMPPDSLTIEPLDSSQFNPFAW